MFVIADCRHIFFPTYLFKIQQHNGSALGTMDLQNAMMFKFRRDAETALSEIKDNGPFTFKIHELGIIR